MCVCVFVQSLGSVCLCAFFHVQDAIKITHKQSTQSERREEISESTKGLFIGIIQTQKKSKQQPMLEEGDERRKPKGEIKIYAA
jgi:hypothetical protein